MKASEIRELSVAELNEKLSDLKAELFNLRFQHAINQLDNPMRLKAVRKEIAVIKTIIRERDLTYADFYENAQTIFSGKEPQKPDFTTHKEHIGMWE